MFEIIKQHRGILAILPGRVIEVTDDHEYACHLARDLHRQARGRLFAPDYVVRDAAA